MMREASQAPLPRAAEHKCRVPLAREEKKDLRPAIRSSLEKTPEHASRELTTLTHCSWDCKMVRPLLENSLAVPQKSSA